MIKEAEQSAPRHSNHTVNIDNRSRASVTGVTDVDSFDEGTVAFSTEDGFATIVGQHLHISRLNLEDGQMVVEGEIYGLEYSDREAHQEKSGGFFSKLWK
ncbi:MAG: sporulation protein YabP [Bacillota bacterium]|nr:sporulation protein YabP [Bacillota bacterium]